MSKLRPRVRPPFPKDLGRKAHAQWGQGWWQSRGCLLEEVRHGEDLREAERELPFVKGLSLAQKMCSKGGFIYLPVKLLFPFFKMRYLRLGKVEQTDKIIQQGK